MEAVLTRSPGRSSVDPVGSDQIDHSVEINLDKVEALRVEQGFLGRMLNYGTIFISGAGTSVAPIRNIADPLVFRRKFMEATNRPMAMPRQ